MAFATLPHIKTCGHEVTFDDLHNTLIKGFGENVISATIETYQSYYNCLGLSCDDVGSYDRALGAWDSVAADIMLPECLDITMIAGYLPENATKTNMVSKFCVNLNVCRNRWFISNLLFPRRLPGWTSTLWQSIS